MSYGQLTKPPISKADVGQTKWTEHAREPSSMYVVCVCVLTDPCWRIKVFHILKSSIISKMLEQELTQGLCFVWKWDTAEMSLWSMACLQPEPTVKGFKALSSKRVLFLSWQWIQTARSHQRILPPACKKTQLSLFQALLFVSANSQLRVGLHAWLHVC